MKLTENCYVISGLFTVSPWIVNAGFVTGKKTTLVVDTGANSMSAQTLYGYAKCAAKENHIIVINTEPHFDHILGNCYFKEKGAIIYAHKNAVRTEEEFQENRKDYNDTIVNIIRKEAHEEELLFHDTSLAIPDIRIESNETNIDLGELKVKVLLTSGHTEQNLSIFIPDEKVLFCGDTIVEGYIPNMEDSDPAGWKEWLKSLDLIEKLKPEYIVPGHGRVLSGENIQKEINRMRRYLETGLKTGKAPTVR